ncbi:MAG: FlgD immunoglobulin-like domain containing protein [Candidatus Glassbacteria bacterium]
MKGTTRYSNCKLILILCLTAAFLSSADSYAKLTGEKELSPPSPVPLDLSQVWHNENECEVLITNVGPIGQNLLTGSGAGFWPTGSGNSYIFGNGLWIGGIADVNGDQVPDTITVIGYDPSQGQTEFREGRVGQSTSDPLARVFDSRDSTDLEEWPDEFRNPGGDPLVLSQQDLVTIYNDISGEPLGAYRLGIQVNQRSMAFTGKVAGVSVHALYFIWTIVNMSDSLPDGPYTIEDMYVGHQADIDIGGTATDDMTSFIPTFVEDADTILLNTAVTWDATFFEVGFDGEVGLLGFTFDETMAPGADVNYTFMSNPSNNQPRPDPNPADDIEQYNILACLDGQCEEHDIATDIRFVLSIGPVDLAPGEVQRYRAVLFFADPFAEPTGLSMPGDPPRVDPYQQAMANFIQVAKEVKESLRTGVFPSPFTIFRTSIHEDTADTTGPYTIHTGITDSIGLKEATLHYSTDGGSTFNPVAMSPSAILNYSGDIPGQPSETTVLYYVEATDSADVVLTDPANAPDSVYSFLVEVPSGIDTNDPAGPGIPQAVSLGQNYPNPFNPSTVITFTIAGNENGKSSLTLEIFDTRGRLVRTLIDGRLDPGTHQVTWDGKNESGESAGSGIYIYRLKVDGVIMSRKMVLLK